MIAALAIAALATILVVALAIALIAAMYASWSHRAGEWDDAQTGRRWFAGCLLVAGVCVAAMTGLLR